MNILIIKQGEQVSEPITISFVGNTEIKAWLEQWAKEDDRSMSYVIRQILRHEVQRRTQPQIKPQPTNSNQSETQDVAQMGPGQRL
jgi:hypothetical protein